MRRMHAILSQVQLQPVSSDASHKFTNYYSDSITYWDRSTMDTRKAIFPHLYTFEKLFPIPSSPKDFKLLSEFQSLSH